jgi:hypothetical protein
MPRKKIAPEPAPEPPFTEAEMDDLTMLSRAVAKNHLTKIEYRLQKNLRERSALEQMKYHLDAAIALAGVANRIHDEPAPYSRAASDGIEG